MFKCNLDFLFMNAALFGAIKFFMTVRNVYSTHLYWHCFYCSVANRHRQSFIVHSIIIITNATKWCVYEIFWQSSYIYIGIWFKWNKLKIYSYLPNINHISELKKYKNFTLLQIALKEFKFIVVLFLFGIFFDVMLCHSSLHELKDALLQLIG